MLYVQIISHFQHSCLLTVDFSGQKFQPGVSKGDPRFVPYLYPGIQAQGFPVKLLTDEKINGKLILRYFG